MDARCGGAFESGCGELSERTLDTPAGSLHIALNKCTYEPSDDTILAIQALALLASEGRSYKSVIDLGTGSGVLALAAREIFNAPLIVAVDIHECPAYSARRNLGSEPLVAVCRSASCISGFFDLAILNPPYLPIDPGSEGGCEGVEGLAWSGGGGVMEELIRASAGLASEVIAVYSSLSPVNPVALLEKLGFNTRILASKRFFMESLEVVHAWTP